MSNEHIVLSNIVLPSLLGILLSPGHIIAWISLSCSNAGRGLLRELCFVPGIHLLELFMQKGTILLHLSLFLIFVCTALQQLTHDLLFL